MIFYLIIAPKFCRKVWTCKP